MRQDRRRTRNVWCNRNKAWLTCRGAVLFVLGLHRCRMRESRPATSREQCDKPREDEGVNSRTCSRRNKKKTMKQCTQGIVTSIHIPTPYYTPRNHCQDEALVQSTNRSILGKRSGMRKGLLMASSMPASMACLTCSGLAFADTAMTGMCPRISPDLCSERIVLTHCRPPMTGISRSIRMMSTLFSLEAWLCQWRVVLRKSRASWPWSAVCTS